MPALKGRWKAFEQKYPMAKTCEDIMNKKSMNLSISIWYKPEQRCIKMVIKGKSKDHITTISEDPKLKRGHPHLFGKFKSELVKDMKWNER